MADLLTTDQKNKLRADGHHHKFFLAVCKPSVLLSAQVNGTFSQGAISISFDNGTAAAPSAIREGQTVKVVTTWGTFETRLVSYSGSGSSPTISGTIVVDPNAYYWPNNGVITIEDMHDPRSIPPEFDSGTGVSKKRSAAFINQTVRPGPIARMRGHQIKRLSGGSAVFTLNGLGRAVAPGATITSHLWQCASGTIASSSSQNTTITFTAAGGYWVYYTCTDSNSKTHTTVRYFWVFPELPETTTGAPYTDFSVGQISHSADGGGSVSLKVDGVADFTEFRDGALVAIWCETWYGSEAGPISLITGSENIRFTGYIVKDTITTNHEHSSVTFEAQNIISLMKSLPMQALSIHAEKSIQYWFQTDRRMTLIIILQWLLHWHSNLLTVAEWDIPTGGLYKKLFSFNEGALGQMVADIASKFVSLVGCDKAGNIYVERNLNTQDDAGRAAAEIVSEITKADLREQWTIVYRERKTVSAVKVSGFYYDGANQLAPYCAIAPSRIGYTAGQSPTGHDGLVLSGQSMANLLSGRFLAIANTPIEELRCAFAGDYSAIDMFPQRWWRASFAAGDTARGIEGTDLLFVPRSMTQSIDVENGLLTVDAIFEPEALGPNGVSDPCPSTGTVTKTPEEKSPTGGAEPISDAPAGLVSVSSLRYLAGNSTVWTTHSTQAANDGSLDPFWKLKTNSVDPLRAIYWLVGDAGMVQRVVSSTNLDPRSLTTDPPNSWSDATAPTIATTNLTRIASSIFTQNRHYVAANHLTVGGLWRSWLAVTDNDFQTFDWTTLFQTSDVQTRLLSIAEDMQDGTILWLTCWRNGTLWLEQWSTATMTRTSNVNLGSATLAEIDDLTYVAEVAAAPGSKATVYVFGRVSSPAGLSGVHHIIRSTNTGSSFSNIENGWSTDHCAAFAVGLESGGNRNLVAVRRGAV